MGLAVGQGVAPAGAQTEPTQSVEEKAAGIKERLVAVISAYNDTWADENKRFLRATHPTGQYYRSLYLADLAASARQDTILGHYLRYMSGVLRSNAMRVSSPAYHELLLQDRFLDHFSQELASTGLPPVVPSLTDDELKAMGPIGFSTGKLDRWPYSEAAATVFGVD